jgi:AraC family transcriptional regulator, transcriptional activator of pobA
MAMAHAIRYTGGVPVYRYPSGSDTPPLSLLRAQGADLSTRGRHIHEFPLLWYVPATGAVYVVAAGVPIEPDLLRAAALDAGIGIFFDPAAVGEDTASPWPTWRAHPLLFPFLHGRPGGLLQMTVPPLRRPFWDHTIAAMETELAQHRDGYRQAALAHLTLLLIDLARIADDVVGDLRRSGEPLLAEVFSVIESRPDQPLSLRDVAAEVGMSAGHLTTVVRERTGRTVQDWITDAKMTRARQLLAGTDLRVGEIASRLGMSDPAYFSRVFTRRHGMPPRRWRSAMKS